MKKTDTLSKSSPSLRSVPTWSTIDTFDAKVPSKHENTSNRDTVSNSTDGHDAQHIRRNPVTHLPLRNTSPYGRHSNDWLFGSIRIRDSIKKIVGAGMGENNKSSKSNQK